MASDEMKSYLMSTAASLGIHPSDLATAISYETGGKMDPNLWGGAGGKHLGLIQFGPEEQAKYGVKPDMPLGEHFGAVEGFLRDRGVKPGMGLLDIYSTINAGRPGLYNRSDANNGGAPGTVADKVGMQMVGHRKRADALLGSYEAPVGGPVAQMPVAPQGVPVAQNGLPVAPVQPENAPLSLAPPPPEATIAQKLQAGGTAMSNVAGRQPAAAELELLQPNFATPPGIAKIRAQIAARRTQQGFS